MLKYKIILASKSKRRSKILKECGIPHEVVVSNIHEKMDHKKGAKFNVLHNAQVKAKKIAVGYKEMIKKTSVLFTLKFLLEIYGY